VVLREHLQRLYDHARGGRPGFLRSLHLLVDEALLPQDRLVEVPGSDVQSVGLRVMTVEVGIADDG